MSRRATSGLDLKTSFSRYDPIPRGQATVIRSLIRRCPKATNNKRSRATSSLPTSSPSTISGRLGHPWFHKNWARTSRDKTQNTWKPPDQSSLHDICRTGTDADCVVQTFISSKDINRSVSTPKRIGGAERDRTADPLLAKQVLSQLSYSPNHRKHPTAKPSGISKPNKPSAKANGGPGKT